MFTIEQIEAAHEKVKSGADFPNYIREIKELGVVGFETRVPDSRTEYFGENDYKTVSNPQYAPLIINEINDKELFISYLQSHQRGETDYLTFCKHCALTGVEKWLVNLQDLTCTYYDKSGNNVLVEKIPV